MMDELLLEVEGRVSAGSSSERSDIGVEQSGEISCIAGLVSSLFEHGLKQIFSAAE